MSTLPIQGSPANAFALSGPSGKLNFNPGTTTNGVVLLFFFKRNCSTCNLIAPVIELVYRSLNTSGLSIISISQSDETDTIAFTAEHNLTFPVAIDTDLEVSECYGFDAVPALVLTAPDGEVLESFEGWNKTDMIKLVEAAAKRCSAPAPNIERNGVNLPSNRPGCASTVHDPNVARILAMRRGSKNLTSRRIRIPTDHDAFEFLEDQGLSDGLPVIPPTEERVLLMLSGTTRDPSNLVADIPPNLTPATVEKVAVNAVMAGCLPSYLPVVLAAVEAACTSEFNLHGVLATTYSTGPVIIVNGPIRHEIGINCKGNVFGQGSRANATIGRALQLVVRNIGGGKPGEVDMATLGQPGKYTCCIGENEEASYWEPLHVERGFDSAQNTVTLFAGEAPRIIRDQMSRNAPSLSKSLAMSLDTVAHAKLHAIGEVLLVVSPEHARTFKKDGFTKDNLRERIQEDTARPLQELIPNEECQKGMAAGALPQEWTGLDGRPTPASLTRPVPKFRSSEDILIVVAGGTAGKFSAVVGGWVSGGASSKAVTQEITL